MAYCHEHGIEPTSLKPYFLRHSFLSRWVEDAGDIYIVAQLCGTSVKMVEKRYGHPNVDSQPSTAANDNRPKRRTAQAAAR